MCDDELWTAFREFSNAVIEATRTWAAEMEVPTSFETEVHFSDSGYTERIIPVVRYMVPIKRHYEDILQMPVFQRCLLAHVEGGVLQRLSEELSLAEHGSEEWLHDNGQLLAYMIDPIFKSLGEANSLDLPEVLLRAKYVDFRHAWTCPRYHHGFHVKHPNSAPPLTPPPLGGSNLQRQPNHHNPRLWNGREGGGAIPNLLDFQRTKYQLTTHYEVPRGQSRDPQTVLDDAERLLTAMRLHKPYELGIYGMYFTKCPIGTTDIGQHSCGQRSLFEPSFRTGLTATPYELESKDLDEVCTLANGIQKADDGLQIAIGRFNQAYERRRSIEDKLIDLTIALESTLLSDVQDELKYRLSVRCAALLSDECDPIQTHFIAKKVYDARSQVVHQGQRLDRQKLIITNSTVSVTPKEFVREAEALTRAVLRRYVIAAEAGTSTRLFTSSIDRQIMEKLSSTNEQDTGCNC